MAYKYNKKWRLAHTKKRNEGRRRYYSQFNSGNTYRRKRWDFTEIYMIRSSLLGDRALHGLLGRSVVAIQVKRCKLRREEA